MKIIQAILVFSSTFSIKSLSVTPVTSTISPVGIKTTMARKRGGATGTTKPKKAEAKAPTVGLEDVVFEFGANMRPGDFQGFIDSLSGHMAGALKYGGATAAKAIRKMTPPTFSEPAEPADPTNTKQKITYEHKLKKWLREEDEWTDINGRIFEKFKEHCAESMLSKLSGMAEYDGLDDDQDGIRLVKLLREIYFEQDGTRQAMAELVAADKRLMLCWQRPGWTLEEYTREFRARVKVAEEAGSTLGLGRKQTEIVCKQHGADLDDLQARATANPPDADAKVSEGGAGAVSGGPSF